MARKQKRKTVAVKKKQWIRILSPEKKELGESHVEDPNTLIGRKVKVNLMSYMGSPKNRKFNVKFLITDLNGGSANTRICGFETQPTALKMVVKKGSDRVDHTFNIKTKNKESLIIKPIITTRRNVSAAVKTSIRKLFEELITKEANRLSTDQIFNDVIFQKIQRNLKKELSKIYPIKGISIKKMDLVIPKNDDRSTNKQVKLEETNQEEPQSDSNEDDN